MILTCPQGPKRWGWNPGPVLPGYICGNQTAHSNRSCCRSLRDKHSCSSFEGSSVAVSRGRWPHLRRGMAQALCAVGHECEEAKAVWNRVRACSICVFLQPCSQLLLKKNRTKTQTVTGFCCWGWTLPAKLLLKNNLNTELNRVPSWVRDTYRKPLVEQPADDIHPKYER